MSRILIVEDEPAVRLGLRLSLSQAGYSVREAASIKEAWEKLVEIDLLLLDWMLPDQSGIQFLEALRQRSPYQDLPVLMLTARVNERDRVEGLTKGADDYLTKPFSSAELLARILALLRRSGKAGRIERRNLVLDLDQHQASLAGKALKLTRREFELLLFLARHAGRVYSRQELLEKVWGEDFWGTERTVDQHIAQLRDKLEDNFIETLRGLGYRFVDSDKD